MLNIRQFMAYKWLIAAVIFICSIQHTQANLITDPGFEDTLRTGGGLNVGEYTVWEVFNSDTALTSGELVSTNQRTGAQALGLSIPSAANNFVGVFQDIVNVSAGQLVEFGGWHQLLSPAAAIEIRIEWWSTVTNTEVSKTANLTPLPSNTAYELFSLQAVVPDFADVARLVYALQSFSGPAPMEVLVDDTFFTVTQVSDPFASGLLIVGMLCLVFRNRCKP